MEGDRGAKKEKVLRYVMESREEGEKGRRDGEAFVVFVRMGGEEIGGGGGGWTGIRIGKGEGRPHRLPPLTWPPSNQGKVLAGRASRVWWG